MWVGHKENNHAKGWLLKENLFRVPKFYHESSNKQSLEKEAIKFEKLKKEARRARVIQDFDAT